MDIQAVSKAVQAIRLASDERGILGIRGNGVHLNNETFESVVHEYKMKPLIEPSKISNLLYEVSFIHDNVIYYSFYTAERIKTKLGGNVDELTTTN